MATATGWFIQRDGQHFGPYSAAQLKQMAGSGQILPVDLISKEPGGPWKAASQVKGLFATIAPQPVPLPPPIQPPIQQSPIPASLSLFANLSATPKPAMWATLVGSVGLGFIMIGLICPWYETSSNVSVDMSAYSSSMSGFGGKNMPRGGDFDGRTSESNRAGIMGISSIPGVFAFLIASGIGGLFYLPKRLFLFIATALAALLVVVIFGSFLYSPGTDISQSSGTRGMGSSMSFKTTAAWGQFISLLGTFAVLTMGVLIFLGIATKNAIRRTAQPSQELNLEI